MSERRGLRVKCSDKCILSYDGATQECVLENISLSGALISVKQDVAGISTGSRCGLFLCTNPRICPLEYNCTVAHITSHKIGLQFNLEPNSRSTDCAVVS